MQKNSIDCFALSILICTFAEKKEMKMINNLKLPALLLCAFCLAIPMGNAGNLSFNSTMLRWQRNIRDISKSGNLPHYSTEEAHLLVISPIDELISILEQYAQKMSAAANEDEFHALEQELKGKVQELNVAYPEYEPKDADMARFETAFNAYLDSREKAEERLEIEPDEDDMPSGGPMWDQDAVDEFLEPYKQIEDREERVLKILEDYTGILNEITTFNEVLTKATEMEGVLDYIERQYSNEDETSSEWGEKVSKAIEELGSAFEKAFDRTYSEE